MGKYPDPWIARLTACLLAASLSFVLAGRVLSASPACPPSGVRVVGAPSSPDTRAPIASVKSPVAGAIVGGSVTVSACAADNVAVIGVQLKVDGVNLGAEDLVKPYSVTWNTSSATPGSHTLTAVARDAAGHVTTSSGVVVTVRDTTAPAVSISSPSGGATVTGAVAVTATASDNVGVGGVQFKLDGANLGAEDVSAPYSVSWNTAAAANGAHTITAVARDAAANVTTSGSVAVTVSNVPADTTPPSLSAIAAVSIGASVATITWTTNETSDSQVDYGPTTAYGSTTPLNTSLLTAHTVALTGLTSSTLYHFRVRARDAAGNLAVSGDSTFTTLAGAPTTWPHEPAGFALHTDWAVGALAGSGWNTVNANGYASITRMPRPRSPRRRSASGATPLDSAAAPRPRRCTIRCPTRSTKDSSAWRGRRATHGRATPATSTRSSFSRAGTRAAATSI